MHSARCHSLVRALALVLLLPFSIFAQSGGKVPDGFTHVQMQVGDLTRDLLVYAPKSAKEKATPIVFVFHGHGGNAQNAARSFAMNQHWPEAISVCMQGLNTPGR